MTAITHAGDTFDITLNITIRRTLSLQQRVHGSLTIGDTKHISAWDIAHFVQRANRYGDTSICRNARGFDTFFPYHLEINNAMDAWAALQNATHIYSDNLRFNAIMILVHSEPSKIFCPETGECSINPHTTYYAPATSMEDIERIQNKTWGRFLCLDIAYTSDDAAIEEKLLENPGMFKTPIVRNGKKATVGYQPEVWAAWSGY